MVEVVLFKCWFEEGSFKFEVCLLVYYFGGFCVLKDFCLNIKFGEKIGIIGCIGVGKFFLVFVLFRMLELKGMIFIGGIFINILNVLELRKFLIIVL